MFVVGCFLSLTAYSYVIADDIATVSTNHDREVTLTHKVTESVVEKSMDSSETITNLSNTVLIVTAIILAITALIVIFSIVSPLVMLSYIRQENDKLKQEIESMKGKVYQDLQNEFRDELIGILKGRIEKRLDYYQELTESRISEQINLQSTQLSTQLNKQMNQQSAQHEERLYFVEKVHLGLLITPPKEDTITGLRQWIEKQQTDYFALLQLISPSEDDTFIGLGIFEGRDDLPESFLFFLRFLKEQNRLPGKSLNMAQEITKNQFNEEL